jgi:flavin reductase (DIM6/NTAB) family NADH-FMN oxidoreductase RutF
MKVKKIPWAALYPCPVVLATCVASDGKPNIIPLAWAGVACSDPPIIGLAIKPSRYSYKLIEESGDFVVNIPNMNLSKEADFCGMVSGRNVDKFKETGLTAKPSDKVKAPLIQECPVNLECVLKKKIHLGVHDLFLGEVVLVHVDKNTLDEKEEIDFNKVTPFVFMPPPARQHGGLYWGLSQEIERLRKHT